MPQLLVRNLKTETLEQLKHRAKANHRSLESEAKCILESATTVAPNDFWQSAEHMRMRLLATGQSFSDSAELLRENGRD